MIIYYFAHIIFCKLLNIKRNKFCTFLLKTESIEQNVNFYAKNVIANQQKLSVSAQNQGLLKKWHTNKWWLCCSRLVTKSLNWGIKMNKTEIRNLKIENWCMVFLDVWILVSVKTLIFQMLTTSCRMHRIEISKAH